VHDPYLLVMCVFAGAILALLSVLLVNATEAPHVTRTSVDPPAPAALATEPPPAPPPAPDPDPPVTTRPLETDAESVSLPSPEDDMPYSVPVAARCRWTRVAEVSSRLAPDPGQPPDFDNGISVSFTSGLQLVSYSSNPAIEATKAGTRVQTCLVQEMRGCPPGDDRGKTYRVYDPRQGIAWSMGDSMHICGGA
jgi:hypothetical protein